MERKNCVVNITLHRSELLYDIGNNAYIHSESNVDLSGKLGAMIKDLTQDGNIDRVNRILGLAYSECCRLVFPYIKKVVEAGERDNRPEGDGDYVFSLLLPLAFPEGNVDMLKRLLHEYMVCYVLGDWLGIVAPGLGGYWNGKKLLLADDIRHCMLMRTCAVRRKMNPS